MSARRGFTLIEVMIAVVILAVGLSSLFTSEAAAVRIAQRARTTTVATLLARCKMAEIEERIAKEGWPGEQIDGRDECCEDAEHDGFRCEWIVERISMPELGEEGEEGEDKDKDKDKGDSLEDRLKQRTSGVDPKAAATAAAGAAAAATGGAGALGGAAGGAGDGGLSEILTAVGATAGSGGGDPFATMVMELTFPVLKPVIEESVRKATVKVTWNEGSSEQNFEVVQFLVNELPMLPDENATEALQGTGGGTAGTAGTGAGAAPGAAPSSGAPSLPGARR